MVSTLPECSQYHTFHYSEYSVVCLELGEEPEPKYCVCMCDFEENGLTIYENDKVKIVDDAGSGECYLLTTVAHVIDHLTHTLILKCSILL